MNKVVDENAQIGARSWFAKLFGGQRPYNPMSPAVTTLMAFLVPALLVLLVFRFFPVVIAIVGSFFRQNLMGEFSFGGWYNYLRIITDEGFWDSIGVTLLFNLVMNPLQVFLAFCLAMLTFRPGKGIRWFRVALFLPMTFSTSMVAVLWQLLLHGNVGPVNAVLNAIGIGAQPFFLAESQALWTLIAIASWKSAGYWSIFVLTGLYAISTELYEAAELDGANWFQRLFYITLPQLKRTLAFVLVADTAVNFLFFAPVYIITKGGPNGSTSLLMYKTYETAFIYSNWGEALALSTVLLILISIVAAFELIFMRERGAQS